MVRAVLTGVIALVALVGVLGAVFAVGLLRIRLADSGSPPPDAAPATLPAATQPIGAPAGPATPAGDPHGEAVPALAIDSIELPAEKATLTSGLTLEKDVAPRIAERHKKGGVGSPDPPPPVRQAITGWRSDSDSAEWPVKIPKAGVYEIDLVYSSVKGAASSLEYELTVGDQHLSGEAAATRGGRESYKVMTVGNATLPAGDLKVRFHLSEQVRYGLLRLRSVRIIPAS